MRLTSTNKKILIISDIHQNWSRANKVIDHESPDEVVFLGDMFDSFVYNTIQDFEVSARWLLNRIDQPNFHFICGNHDLNYLFPPSPHLVCSGYTVNKRKTADHLGLAKLWKKFCKFHVYVDDYLCTHAGLHPRWIGAYTNGNFESIDIFLNHETRKAELNIELQQKHWFWAAGYARGGDYPHGGLVWLDEEEFEPITGVKQIFGHSNSRDNKIYVPTQELNKDPWISDNIVIDCNLMEYIVIENGKRIIKSFLDL